MSTLTIAKHYIRILSLWPKDLLRPGLPFQRALQYRASQYGVPLPEAPTDSKATDTPPKPASPPDPKVELLNINALYSLLDDRYMKRYPPSERLLQPTHNPNYYKNLMEEIDRAPTKSWLQSKLERWSQMIRWR